MTATVYAATTSLNPADTEVIAFEATHPWQRIYAPPMAANLAVQTEATSTPAQPTPIVVEPASPANGLPTEEPVPVASSVSAAPEVVRGGTSLPVPDGTEVVWGGCASDGTCYWYNFYWAPTHEVVMQPNEGQHKVQHELCHAHQHGSINGGAPLDPSDYDLESWYGTAEGQSFTGAVASLPWPWTHSAVSGLEDFAWTCAYWYLDPAYLLQVSPERYGWAAANLP